MRMVYGLVGVLLLGTVVAAQTTTTAKATWIMNELPAVASGYTYTLKDGTTTIPFTGAVSCVAPTTGGGSACQAPLAPLTSGPHTLVLTAASALGSASSDVLAGSTPGKPTGFTITITISGA